MSKPSTTNCPKTFVWGDTFRCWLCICDTVCLCAIVNLYRLYVIRLRELSGGYCGGVPPLPIPNREVKPTCADGTAMQCGRVGNRLLSVRASRTKVFGALFVYIHSIPLHPFIFLPFYSFTPYYIYLIIYIVFRPLNFSLFPYIILYFFLNSLVICIFFY